MKKLIIGSVLLVLSTFANATLITFNGIGSNFDDPVDVQGYTFDYLDHNGWGIALATNLTSQIGNGTEIIACRDTVDFSCTIRMSSSDNSLFSLTSFEGADHSLGFGGFRIDVVGNLFGGGSITESFSTVADVFSSFSLTNAFTNLTSVEFRFSGVLGNDGFSLDNIIVNEGALSVSEPQALVLFGMVILSLVRLRRE